MKLLCERTCAVCGGLLEGAAADRYSRANIPERLPPVKNGLETPLRLFPPARPWYPGTRRNAGGNDRRPADRALREEHDMPAQLGKIYITPGGAEMIVTKGSTGTLSDGDTPLLMKDAAASFAAGTAAGSTQIQLGKRYKSADGSVEVLVNKPGTCDLRYDGQPMELKEAKPLPSSD